MNKKNMKILALPAVLFGLAACATSEPAWQTAELGASVASMVEGQILDPEAAANPREGLVEGTEGEKTAAVIAAWRKSLAAPKESTGDVVINVGK